MISTETLRGKVPDNFSDGAKAVLWWAQVEAEKRGSTLVTDVDLLTALFKGGIFTDSLRKLGIFSPGQVLEKIQEVLKETGWQEPKEETGYLVREVDSFFSRASELVKNPAIGVTGAHLAGALLSREGAAAKILERSLKEINPTANTQALLLNL